MTMSFRPLPGLPVLAALLALAAVPARAAEPQSGGTPAEGAAAIDELPTEGDPRSRLVAAYLALHDVLGGRGFEVAPKKGLDVGAALEARYGVGLDAVLLEKAQELDGRLAETGAAVCAWLPLVGDAALRERVLAEEAALDALRAEALGLIEVYERPKQNLVDANRKRVEAAYATYAGLVAEVFAGVDERTAQEAADVLAFVRRGEAALALVDAVLVERGGIGVERREAPGHDGVFTATGTFFEATSPYLPDFAYLLLLGESEATVEMLQRIDPIQVRIDIRPTPFERWLLRELRARGVERFNSLAVHTGTANDAAFTPVINDYRRGLGLDLLTVDERLVIAARQHSQEQVDLDYFDHMSPTARKRSPGNRVRLENYDGMAAENLAIGRDGYKAASVFEGWYRSPGHHRNMVGPHHPVGAATDAAASLWTLLLGSGDTQWRDWHADLAPARRVEFTREAGKLLKLFVVGKLKERVYESELLPLVSESSEPFVAAVLRDGAGSDDGARRHAIEAHARLVASGRLPRVVDCAAVMQILDIAVVSADSAVRRAADEALRALVPGLAPELDALKSDEGSWERVRIAFEDRERVQFKAARPKS